MVTALQEVCELKSHIPQINTNNTNRYCILSTEGWTTTAYCFGVPVYNDITKRLVRREFIQDKNSARFLGANTNGYIHHGKLILTNSNGGICITLPPETPKWKDETLIVGSWKLRPSFNGVHVHCTSDMAQFKIHVDRGFSLRHNSKSFCLMKDQFLPFLTVSPLFASDEAGIAYPSAIEYEEESNRSYSITVGAKKGTTVDFEVNLYEPKLFQDTTVESLHPKENNAYGGIAFLGKTAWTGEQWLYSRLDLTKIPELGSKTVKKAFLHIPIWNSAEYELSVFTPTARFCSFGSNWENKVNNTEKDTTISHNGKYLTIDTTKIFTDATEHCLIPTQGLVLKPRTKHNHPVVISTGDNYTLPQILEVQYES